MPIFENRCIHTMKKHVRFPFILLLALVLFACNNTPKVVESEQATSQDNAPIFQDEPAPAAEPENQAEHKVVALESMNTSRYTYLRVSENGEEFWVATALQDVKLGGTYYFQRALLKQNFPSQEFNRVFETLYLVSDLREQPMGTSTGMDAMPEVPVSLEVTEPIKPTPGAIKISEIFANPAKFNGKKVKVTGKCVKINPMIMGRNWVHLQDGSGKNLDLTITTMENIPLGAILTLEGTIATNKDFGAGYKYDVIMEGAALK